MGKKKTTSESTQTSTPTASPQLNFALDQNRSLFNTLSNRTAPDFNTVAPLSGQTENALNLIEQRAIDGSPLIDAAQGAVGGIASNGAFDTSFFDQLAGGQQNPFTDAIANGGVDNAFLTQLANGGGDFLSNLASGGVSNPAAQFFEATARGDFLDPQNNPAFALGVESINDSVGSIFERAGRTGSGANQSSVARGVADLSSNLINQERGRQLQAGQTLAGLFNSDISNAINASGLQGQQALASQDFLNSDQFNRAAAGANLFNQDASNALNAGSLLGDNARTQLSAAGLAPGLANADFTDLQALLGAGGVRDNQAQREIDDQIARFNFPFENQIAANDILTRNTGGLAALLGGTTTGNETTTSSPGLFNSLLGAASIGASFFG